MTEQFKARQIRQADRGYGPVTLVYSDRPLIRSGHSPMAMMRSEVFATNGDALDRVVELAGGQFHGPHIVGPNREDIWNAAELGQLFSK